MAIDTSIYGQIQQPQFESPVNALAKVAAVRNAQNQNRLFDMQVAAQDRAQKVDQDTRAAYALDDPTARSKALRLADPKAYREDQTFQTTQQKAQREAEKAQIEGAIQKQGIVAQYAGSAKDQPSWTAAKQALASMGIDVSQVPDQYDPNTAQTLLQRSLTGVQQLEQTWKQKNFDLDTQKFGETVRNNKTQNGIAAGNLGVAREGLGLRKAELEQKKQADGTASGKPLTEGQSKAALFGSRMQSSDEIINGLAAKGVNNSVPGTNLPIVGRAITAFSPAERQQLDQAKRDFINATLRRESGAVIADSEFANGEKQYFPQPGDSKEVIAQKARNRQIATRGVLAEVPEGRRDSMVKQIIGDKPASNIDSLLDKYK